MVSSLAAQLAQSASLNASLLVDRSRRKAGESYLFTGREADQYDLESIHALATNGLLQLAALNPRLRSFEDILFSEAAKTVDRTLQPAEANALLDKSVASFLRLLGPYLMEGPTGKVIEWLIRRFRINEFNVEDILGLFLPYHESPHFAKMVTILHIKENSTWSFLLAFKSAAQCVPRISLVTEMLRNSDVTRFVTALLPDSIKGGYSHRALLAFNAATLHDFIIRNKSLDEGTFAFLLPALLEPLRENSKIFPPKDSILGSYILLSALSQKCRLSSAALKAVVDAMTRCASRVSTRQFLSAVVSVCEPQEELDSFSDVTVGAVLRLSNVEEEVRKASDWVGIEMFICPLLSSVGRRILEPNVSSFLESIMASPRIPTVVIRHSTMILLKQVVLADSGATDVSAARRLLAHIQERHPSVFQGAAKEISSQDDGTRGIVEQLIISLSMTYITESASSNGLKSTNGDMIIASTSADVEVRIIAVKSLLNTLSGQNSVEAIDLESIHTALLARIQDTNPQILEALYHNPSIITPILSKNVQAYIDYLALTLCAPDSKPKRLLLKTHLTFLALHVCPTTTPSVLMEIFNKVFFPFLLFSKPRQRTAEAVWEIIAQSLEGPDSRGIGAYELLGGCVDAWKWEKEKGGVDAVEKLSAINIAIASKIAETILVSNNYSVHLEALLAKLRDSNPHARVLGYLITRALLGRLSGEHQIDAVHKVLVAMGLEQLTGIEDFLHSPDKLQDFLHDTNLGKNVVLKPSSRNTTRWLQTSIIALIPSIPRPMGAVVDWFGNSASESTDNRGPRFVGLMRTIYKLANSSTSVPLLTINLLRGLFINLKDEALAFLAGIWTGSDEIIDGNDQLPTVALHHATAYLKAHLDESEAIDYQTILPSLVVAVQSSEVQQRQAALECISLLLKLAQHRFSIVYGFDTIYGANSGQLQYLDQDDLKKYLGALSDHQDHLLNDPTYIRIFHQQHLGKGKSDKKRDIDYKQRVLCYLLSHVDAVCMPNVQIPLLRSIEDISNEAKAEVLLPTIQALVQDSGSNKPASFYGSRLEEFATLVVASLDVSAAGELNEQNSSLWPGFISTLRHYLKSGSMPSPRAAVTRSLERGLFGKLSIERQIEVCDLLLAIGAQDSDAHAHCKSLLANVVLEAPLMVQLLNSHQPTQNPNAPRASKRAKLADVPEDALSTLSLLAEVLGTKSLPGSFDLISRLLETLNNVVQSASSAEADVSYIEQLLMSAVENAAEKIQEVPNVTPSSIRLDILVELIRVANNPQTFHQALLLMASLARLAPDSVLHNVMPVFTFMGSNVFHRDDTYSFRVVQKTVDSIVPVMVSSLKRVHSRRLDLYVGSRDFLRVFTDAANHVPRHRRTHFFAHLVDVLGPDDFLAPVVMLLIEKAANRVIRQSAEDVQASLALPTSLLQHYPTSLQIFILTELMRESQRLTSRVVDPENLEPTVLEGSHDEEHALPISAAFRRRAQALITFVGYALKSASPEAAPPTAPEGGTMSDLVTLLIDMATVQGGATADNKVDDICKASRSSMNRALGVMSAVDFISAVLSMLESGESRVQAGALDLLTERLAGISDKTRQEITPTINKIIDAIRTVLTLHPEGPLATSAFRALKSIGLTTCSGEETSLTSVIPLILGAIRARKMAAAAMPVLSPFAVKLGPRIIPYFRQIITDCVAILREGEEAMVDDTLSVLQALLTSIPTFWGTGELAQVIKLHVDQCAAASNPQSTPMSALMKAVAKRAPTKVLLPTLYEMWSSLAATQQTGNLSHFIGYFDLLKRSLRSAARPAVIEHLRPLFKVFLEAFDVTKVSPTTSKAEVETISAFLELVVKLNEAAFRPFFRRLYDWAFAVDDTDGSRMVTFCHVYIALLDYFKGLMNPYMSFLLQTFVDLLKNFTNAISDDKILWTCIIETLTRSFSFDDGAFWRDDKLRQITSPLIEQVGVCIRLNNPGAKTLLPDCLSALTDSVTDDALLKSINLDLLMHTRSEDARLRIFALMCSETLWRAHGGKLLGFVTETTTFIAECVEDENDSVVDAARKLKDAVESVAGSISGL